MLGFGGSSSSSLFDDERDQVVLLNNKAFGNNNGVFEFSDDMKNNRVDDGNNKDSIQFAMEKQRRVHFNDKFQALRKLIPNPTKNDRASILDAIEYINELKSTVSKLKVVVEKKRSRERINNNKRQKTTTEDNMVQSYNNNGRSSSWHHRKSNNNNTEVDVRIIEDEVTVKLVQRKGTHNNNNINNSLLLVSKVVDDFHLDLYHVAGGLIGDYYSFLFNSKILEGTTVYASAIANMLIQAAEKHYCSLPLLHPQANVNSDSLEADIYKNRSK